MWWLRCFSLMEMIQLLQCFAYLLLSSFKSFAVEFYGFTYLLIYFLETSLTISLCWFLTPNSPSSDFHLLELQACTTIPGMFYEF